MTKKIKLLALIATVFILNAFFFVEIGSVGIFLITLTLLFATFAVAVPKLDKTVELVQPGLVVAMTGWMAYLLSQRTQPEVVHVMTIGVIIGLLVLHDGVTSAFSNMVSSLFEVVLLPLRAASNYLWSAVSLLIKPKEDEAIEAKPNKAMSVIGSVARALPLKSLAIGLVVSVPILFFLLMLLRGADPIFAKNLDLLFEMKGMEKLVQRFVWSLVLLAVLAPWFFAAAKKQFTSPLAKVSKLHFVTEWSVVMGLVAFVLATFAWIQWQYIFVPAVSGVQLAQFGIATYSEYVQKGFNEFVFLSMFIQGLLWVGLSALRSHTTKGKRGLFAVQMIVWAEAVFILLAFFRRIWLYQSFHGLTLVRMYGGFVVAWVAIMALGLLGRHFVKGKWVKFELLGTALLLIVMGAMNPVKYVAEVKPPTVNDRVDYTYLSRLSSDGAAGWVSSYQWVKQTLQSDAYQQPMIGPAARKDLLYMPIILRNTLSNRLRLLNKYGTPEEKKEAAQTMMAFSQREVDDALVKISKSKDVVRGDVPVGIEYTPLDQALRAHYSEKKYFDQMVGHEQSLFDLRSRLASGAAYLVNEKYNEASGSTEMFRVSNMNVRPEGMTTTEQGSGQRYIFTPSSCQHLAVCLPNDAHVTYLSAVPNSWLGWGGTPAVYTRDGKTFEPRRSEPETEWNKYVKGNPTDKAAHELLQKEVSLTELLELQRTYFDAYVKAGRQEQVDRTVDLDIDVDVPFLDPIYTYYDSYNGWGY